MPTIQTTDNDIQLLADDFDLKMDASRSIYIRPKNKEKVLKNYTLLQANALPPGLTRPEKEMFLLSTRHEILEHYVPPSQSQPAPKEGVEEDIQDEKPIREN